MQLPVVEIAAEAYHAVWRFRRVLADRAAVPLAIVLATGIVEHLLTGSATVETPAGLGDGDPADGGSSGPGLLGIAYFLASLPFLVSWYRFIIDGPLGLEGRPSFTFGRLEGRFLMWAVVLALVVAAPMIIAGAVAIPFASGAISAHQLPMLPLLLGVFFFILLILASLRLSLIFPAVAVEDPASFARAWDMSKGNSLRMLALAAAVHLPALFFGGILQLMVIGFGLPFSVLLFTDLAISFTIMALGATMFAEAYKRLR